MRSIRGWRLNGDLREAVISSLLSGDWKAASEWRNRQTRQLEGLVRAIS